MINPKRNTKGLVFLFAFVMAFSALATMAPVSEAADNEAPDWSVGDGVALHMSMDFMSVYNAQENNFTEAMEEFISNVSDEMASLNDISITKASIDSVVMLEVTSVTSTTYTVVQTAALEIKFAISAGWNLFYPDAGTYDNMSVAWDSATNKTMSASFDMTLGFVETVRMVLEKDTMALKSVSTSLRPGTTLGISLINIPHIERLSSEDENETAGNQPFTAVDNEVVISFGNMNLNFLADVKFTATAGFAPSFNLFNLPNPDADNWSTETENMTINAGFTGKIDFSATGNYPMVAQINDMVNGFFENVPENITGVNAFPINLASVSIPASEFGENSTIGIVNGAIPQQVVPIPQFEMRGNGNITDNITGYFEDNLTVYYVWSDAFDEEEEDDENITGYAMTVRPSGIPYSATLLNLTAWDIIVNGMAEDMQADMEVIMGSMTGTNMTGAVTFESISTASANEIVNSITQTIDSIVDDDNGFDIVGFFMDSPYYGIIALVGVVVIVGILTRRG